jgi:hypothetical protein
MNWAFITLITLSFYLFSFDDFLCLVRYIQCIPTLHICLTATEYTRSVANSTPYTANPLLYMKAASLALNHLCDISLLVFHLPEATSYQ